MTLIIGAPRKNPDPRPGQSVLERAAGEGYDFHVASKSGSTAVIVDEPDFTLTIGRSGTFAIQTDADMGSAAGRSAICLREIADALEGQAP